MNKSKYMRIIISFGLVIFACAVSSSLAADYVWAPYPAGIGGPWGGATRKIVSADGKLWAATSGGVFYSADGGDTWQEKNTGLTHVNVTDLDVCIPADSNIPTLLATTMIDGFHNSSDLVFISSDGGDNWQSVSKTEWAGKDMWRAALDPSDASCGSMFVSSSSDGPYSEWMLFKSFDGGSSWKNDQSAPITRMVFSADGTLFFSTKAPSAATGGRVYSYSHSCAVDDYCYPTVVKTFSQDSVADLAIGGPAGQQIVVASADSEGLYFSDDSGVNWTKLCDPYDLLLDFAYMQEVAVDPLDPARIVFSVLADFDNIYSININDPATIVGPYGPEGAAISHIYLTNNAEWLSDETSGVFRRKNGEDAFSLSNAGITAASILDFDFSSDDSSVMAVGWKGGLSLWDPVSESWTVADNGLPPNFSVELVKHLGNTVWAGVYGQGLHASFDAGLSWARRFDGVSISAGKHVESLVVMKADPNLALAATGAGVYSTEDGGVKWFIDPQINDKFDWQVEADAQGRLYAGNREGQQGLFFFKEQWSDQWISRGADYFTSYGTQILSLEPSLSVDGRLLAGTFSKGILESLDYGATWSSIGDGALDAATNGVKITKVALANIPGINNRFAAVVKNTREVYATVDGGASWFLVMGGLQLPNEPMPFVETLSFVPGTTRLVAGLLNRGLWYVDLIYFAMNPVTSPTMNDSQTISGVCNTGQPIEVSVAPSGSFHQLTCQNESWSVDITPLQEGENTITASMDDNGAISTIVAKIIVDTTPPAAVSFDETVSPSNLTTQTISGAKEAGTTISAVVDPPAGSISILSAPAASETWQIEIVGLAEGVNILTVTAEDEVGLFSPGADLEIEVDVTSPVFTVDETVILTQDSSCTISGQLDDVNASVSFLPDAGISGFVYDGGSGSWSATAGSLTEGEQVITAVATDPVGNSSGTVEIHITMDTTPPAFSVDQTDITAQSRNQAISGTVEEGAEVIVDLGKSSATADAVEYGPAPGTWSVLLKNLQDGVHEIYFSAIDAAQNSTELTTATITVALGDTTPPDFSVDQTTIENNVIRNQLITGTIENDATVALISLGDLGATSNPVEYDRTAGTWSVLIENLQNGEHVITVVASDTVGNETDPVEIKINVLIPDEDPPDLTVDEKNILTTGYSWTISGTISVANTACETVFLTVGQGVVADDVQCAAETGEWEGSSF